MRIFASLKMTEGLFLSRPPWEDLGAPASSNQCSPTTLNPNY